MSTIQDKFPPAGMDDPSVVVRRASLEQRRVALSLLILGMARPSHAAVDQFLDYTQKQRMSLEDLWLALEHDQPVAAGLLVPSPGRTAILFISPTIVTDGMVESRLAQTICQSQNPQRVRLVQAILDPGQDAESKALRAAGFRNLATLIYMQRVTERSEIKPNFAPAFELCTWSGTNRALFEHAIERSYENTLDCPGLLGLRQISDVLDGHMSSGRFTPDLWSVIHRDGKPAGVMLINLAATHQGAELVYLGLSPEARNKGLARKLLEYGLSLAHRHGASSLTLAVDDQNTPALKLYQSMRFHAYARKHAMIFPIP
ncbi:MAG: GNAT family N-acetyltransferase [Phycisphaeraceae bacterium]|nr:GNAT family N-acetyltransferase [Phycisphaeraceae bacterium]